MVGSSDLLWENWYRIGRLVYMGKKQKKAKASKLTVRILYTLFRVRYFRNYCRNVAVRKPKKHIFLALWKFLLDKSLNLAREKKVDSLCVGLHYTSQLCFPWLWVGQETPVLSYWSSLTPLLLFRCHNHAFSSVRCRVAEHGHIVIMSTLLTQELDPAKNISAKFSPMLQSNKILCHNIYFQKFSRFLKETVF